MTDSAPEFVLPDTAMLEQSSLLSSEERIQEDVVARFASLLSTTSSSRSIVNCLSAEVSSDDVVCALPSLDMQSVASDAASPLPKVGEHRERSPSSATVPEMKASILGLTKSSSAAAAKEQEEKAAQLLSSPTSWTRSSLVYAADAALRNVSDSFQALVDSRVRAWTLLLLKHSLTTGDTTSRKRLLGMLSFKNKMKSCKDSFTTLPLPDAARGQPKDADVILPLLFQANLELVMNETVEPITFQAPGTISGDFSRDEGTPGLTRVDIRLDCSALLESMVEQARLVVFRAVARATSSLASPRPAANGPNTPSPQASTTTGSFTAALSLSEDATAASPSLQKARSSALRLNTILEGTTQTKAVAANDILSPLVHKTPGKSRSVTWNPSVAVEKGPTASRGKVPSPKRQRMGSGKLRSMKSFGRAHAGDDGYDGRNATFGDFGRTPLAAGPVWDKDGRLKNHPLPGGGLTASHTFMDPTESSNAKNATFDLHRPAQPPRSAAVESFLNPPSGSPGTNTSLPRTATALENWLVNATKGGVENSAL